MSAPADLQTSAGEGSVRRWFHALAVRLGELSGQAGADEGWGQDELVSVTVTAQTPGGLVKKVNLMLETIPHYPRWAGGHLW